MQVDVVTLGPGWLWQSSSDDLGAKWLLELLCRSFFKFAHRFHFEHCLFKRPRHMHSFQKANQLQCLCVCCGNPSVNRAEVVVANSRLVYREHRASKQVSVLLQSPLKHNDVSGFVWKLQLCSTCDYTAPLQRRNTADEQNKMWSESFGNKVEVLGQPRGFAVLKLFPSSGKSWPQKLVVDT